MSSFPSQGLGLQTLNKSMGSFYLNNTTEKRIVEVPHARRDVALLVMVLSAQN